MATAAEGRDGKFALGGNSVTTYHWEIRPVGGNGSRRGKFQPREHRLDEKREPGAVEGEGKWDNETGQRESFRRGARAKIDLLDISA